MTHLVFALRRLDPLTRIEFQEYWLQRHAPLVRSYAAALGITRYHQVHTVADDTTYGGAAFDGVAELWFGGQPTADALEAASELLADERTFIDLTSSPITVVDDRVVVDGPFDGMRMTTLLYKRADRSRDEFAAHWAGPHASLALRHGQTLGTNRYVQLYSTSDAATFPPALERGAPAEPEGIGVSYFDPDKIDTAKLEDAMRELQDDATQFVDAERTVSAFGRVERVID